MSFSDSVSLRIQENTTSRGLDPLVGFELDFAEVMRAEIASVGDIHAEKSEER